MTYASSTGTSSSVSAPAAGLSSAWHSVIARAAVFAEGTLDVRQIASVRLRQIAFWHECPIARFEAAEELTRRGVTK